MKYQDLIVWQKAMNVVEQIYTICKKFPKEEKFGLCSQLQRAAVSIPANIAEGRGRKSTKAYVNFLSIAYGSLMEMETLLEIAFRLKYLTKDKHLEFIQSCEEIGKMLNALMLSLKAKIKSNSLSPESRILNPESLGIRRMQS